MARAQKPAQQAVPQPLPPETRTVGQLLAETIKVYGQHFVRALPLGLVVAVSDQLALERTLWEAIAIYLAASPFFTLAYADATRLVTGAKPTRNEWVVALAVGTLVFLPAAALIPWFKLAAIAWLAALGLVVPTALVERRSFSESFGRAFALSRADYVHALGSLAALVLIFGLSVSGLALLLESQADNTVRTAIFLADTVLGPLLFLGAAILYVDQEARLRSRKARGKERDADVPDADDAHGKGDSNAAREPGPAA
jgi:hypothetical protein